jgi:tetratricopeptide (TPR) repeat protein
MKAPSTISVTFFLLMSAVIAFGQTADTDSGIALYREGKYDQSAEALQKVVESDKSNKLAWLYLGASYVKQGKEKEAVKAFRSSKFGYKDLENEKHLMKRRLR